MIELLLDVERSRPLRVLCIGAHCDDIEIGCGATLRRLQRRKGGCRIDWVVLSGSPVRRREARSSMKQFVDARSRGELKFGGFADAEFPAQYGPIKAFFEALKRTARPDVIFCHERDDRHQDHRVVNEMVWNTFRDHFVLEYEIPKWDGGLGQPNVYVAADADDVERKCDVLLASYASQVAKDWFEPETFRALLRMRGVECRAPSGYAEAFHGRKIRFGGAGPQP